MKYKLIFSIALIFVASFPLKGFADTVYLKDKPSLKGIVVENYIDRIVYSTFEGEKEILKSDIERIEYDEPIDNLISLGDSAFQKGYYKAALKYYLMAQQINSDIVSLNNKIYRTETIIFNAPEIQKREYLALKNEIISGRTYQPSSSKPEISIQQDFKKDLGITLSRKKHGRFYIDGLTKNSPFKKAGALKNDAVIAVWYKLCDYLTIGDLYSLLTNPQEAMMTITVERNLRLRGGKSHGMQFVMKWEGAVIKDVTENSTAEKAGLKKGDLVVAIDGKSIRYTSLKAVLKRLNEKRSRTSITIQRSLNVFKST